MIGREYRHILGATAMLAGMAVIGTAEAQTASQSSAATGKFAIEEIIVTARQRAESLQTVPVAVTALDAKFVENSFMSETKELDKYIPNVELGRMQFAGGALTASIRGVSFADLERSFEPAVGVSVDGIFLASNTGAMIDMFDIESVEVLRGPQGTLFGRNTIGGTINVKRSRPTGEWGLKASATLGSYGRNDYKALINAPIVKDVAALKLGFYSFNSDAHTRNYLTGKRDPGEDRMAFTGALLLTPADNFEAQLSVDYIKDDSDYAKLLNLTVPSTTGSPNFCDLFGALACKESSYDVARANGFKLSFTEEPFSATIESWNVNLRMKLDVGQVSFESITGYIDSKDGLSEENAGIPDAVIGIPLAVAVRDQTSSQFSQEIRAITNFDGRLNFVAGAYYFKSKYSLHPQTFFVAGGIASRFEAGQTLDAYAAYAELYYKVLDATRLTVGGRYTHEKKKFDIDLQIPDAGFCPDPSLPDDPAFDACRDPDVSFSKFTPRISLDHRFTDEIMAYATWARGYRSGGWNGRAATITSIGPYDPETVDNYEIGLRSDLFDKLMRLNLTAFHADYKNKQEEVITASPINPLSTETTVRNASAARIRGVEAELQIVPTSSLMLRGSVGYLDGKYKSFIENGVDVKANRNLRYAPDWSISVGGDYVVDIEATGGNVTFGANYKWTDSFTTNPVKDPTGLNRDVIASYGTFDASVTYEGPVMSNGPDMRISAFVNDAFHDDGRVFRTLDAGPWWFADQEPGRTWGVELQVKF